jgi:hypothetical protein
VGTKSGGPMAHLCGPSNTQGYPRCPLFLELDDEAVDKSARA